MGNIGSLSATGKGTEEKGSNEEFDDLSKSKNNNNAGNIPIPKPAKKSRKDILPTDDSLKRIDDHVMKTPRYAESSIEKLGAYLTRTANTDIEKVRAFYKWVTENISYDTETYFGRSHREASNDPKSLLSSRSSVCDGYASIFLLLCEFSQIPVKKIIGHSKGYSYKPGSNFAKDTPTNHAWNAVFVSGEWRLIDTTWGAGVIGDNKQFKKNFTDFYFMTDPELFIADHFPYFDKNEVECAKWQLLKKSMTLETFNKRIKPSRHAREWGVKFKSHPNVQLELKKNLDIKFKATNIDLDSVSVKFYDSNGRIKDQSATVGKHSKHYVITVSPPAVGQFTLEVFGSIDSDSKTLDCLVNYAIDCKCVDRNSINPLPKFSGFYGPSQDCKERGFEDIKKIPAFLASKNGEVCLPLKVKDGTNVMATLYNSDDVKLVQYTLLEKNKIFQVKARFPKKGYFRLVIYSQFNSERYTAAISILVYNPSEPRIACPFPQTYPETLKFKCKLLEPLTRDLPPNTDVRFRFSSTEMSEATLLRDTVPNKNAHSWDTTIKTPPHGDVRISGKTKDGESQWVVYSFRVKKP